MSHKEGPRYVLALDIGTTTVRSIVYDGAGAVVGSADAAIANLSRKLAVLSGGGAPEVLAGSRWRLC